MYFAYIYAKVYSAYTYLHHTQGMERQLACVVAYCEIRASDFSTYMWLARVVA